MSQHIQDAIASLRARLAPYGFSDAEAQTVAADFIRDLVAHGWAPTRVVEPRGEHKQPDPAKVHQIVQDFHATRTEQP